MAFALPTACLDKVNVTCGSRWAAPPLLQLKIVRSFYWMDILPHLQKAIPLKWKPQLGEVLESKTGMRVSSIIVVQTKTVWPVLLHPVVISC